MRVHLPIAAAVALALASPTTVRAQVTGQTTGDSAQVNDAMQELGRFAGQFLKCSVSGPIQAAPLPDGWQPADPNFRVAPVGARYERWETELCGKAVPFLVAFWTEPDGHKSFQVAHPFPAEPPTS